MKHKLLSILLLLCLVTLTACVAGQNELGNSAKTDGDPAGFWLGLWHGLISPITLIISLFNHNVGVYEVHNNGGWYTSGFVLGLLIFLGSGNRSRSKHWHRKKKAMSTRASLENLDDSQGA
jgi:uncharacterized membrane protein